MGTLRAHLSRANPQWKDFDRLREVLAESKASSHTTPRP